MLGRATFHVIVRILSAAVLRPGETGAGHAIVAEKGNRAAPGWE